MESKVKNSLIFIAVLTAVVFCLAFPQPVNQAIGFFKAKGVPLLEKLPNLPVINFKLGLDLQGGSHLVYEADLKDVAIKDKKEAMQGLRDVIERRINMFGVSEPQVAVQGVNGNYRLVVDLSGIKDVQEAIKMIGKTPYLEFRQEGANFDPQSENPTFEPTALNGRFLKKADLSFNQQTMEPEVLLEFNDQGAELFKQITAQNVGKRLAIYIDNVLMSAPTVREEIAGGKAQITGKFTPQEARELVRSFNAGALPVPITLISQTTVGPTLGMESMQKSLKAGLFGFLVVCLFMIAFYRFSGFLSSIALIIYALILLVLFKIIPVTLTLAGIGGAILSVGMAVDANVLIFERQKEERKKGETFQKAMENGFTRAWPSIRDSNLTTLLIAVIMFSFGSSFVKGFAFTLSLGVLTSMFSAIIVTRTLMRIFVGTRLEKIKKLWV
ncbi:MAG: protein translocase subunit SecD [Candidatus Pacebacteria bacterium]|nr:protein translocase subunit SecD [Candidatus Paceibacterota bacterium]